MLETYFARKETIDRRREGLLGNHLDGFAGFLTDNGYTRATGRTILMNLKHLERWMDSQGLEVKALDVAALETFAAHLPGCRCRREGRAK